VILADAFHSASGNHKFDSSFAGLGGCPFVPNAAGNISTEDVINMCEESGVKTGIDVRKVMELSRKLLGILNKEGDSYILKAGLAADLIEKMSAK
jgi:hydroxymethylglutaryl-CoA lyase